jgi:alpha-tubulin suppressor-like RCC1 family protein
MTNKKSGFNSVWPGEASGYYTPDDVYVKKEDVNWLHPALDFGAATTELWVTGCDYDENFNFMTLGNQETNRSCYVFFNLDGRSDWKNVNARSYNAWAVSKGAALWGWGDNYWLGNCITTGTIACTPVQVTGGSLPTGWTCVDGYFNTVAALAVSGTQLWTWGIGGDGQLGRSSTLDTAIPGLVSGTWVKVAMGTNTALAVRSNGTLWAWGFGGGKIGNNSASSQSSPVQVCGFTNKTIKDIAVAASASFAIDNEGALWAWGYSCCGIRGDGATTGQVCTPIQIAAGTKFKCIIPSATGQSMQALDQYGRRFVWGRNQNMTLGIGDSDTTRCISVPTLADNFRWVALSKGVNDTVFGIAMDGSLWAWGIAKMSGTNNSVTATRYCCPVRVGTDKGWISVATGSTSSVALKEGRGGYL